MNIRPVVISTFARRFLTTLFIVSLCSAGLIESTFAQNFQSNYGGFVRAADNDAKISASQAGNLAKRKHGGKVLKITPVKSSSGTNYQVKLLLDSGKVIVVTVDGNTGRVG